MNRAETVQLLRSGGAGASQWLVFTSAGDSSSVQRWLKGGREFDIWITYYGDQPGRYSELADYYLARKGSKFQNLKFCFDSWPDVFEKYSAVLVMDDDVWIRANEISRLFRTRADRDLWVLQPAFSPAGKVNWPITRVNSAYELRFTNFVEMTCPLFRTDKLVGFLKAYDPELVGYGMDWWFLHSMGSDRRGRVAIVDEITCVNPFDSSKGGQREIDKLQSTAERKAVWQRIRSKYAITSDVEGPVQYGGVPAPAFIRLARLVWFECLGLVSYVVRGMRRAARAIR